jgi:predicted RNase H-like HicB family nuclease
VKTYTVRAEWDATGWWVVMIDEIPGAITQSRRLDQVDADVAEIVKLMAGETPEDYTIQLVWAIPAGIGDKAHEAARLRVLAEEAERKAAEATAQAAQELAAAGFTYRDIGSMVGVSHQRAQQLVPGKGKPMKRAAVNGRWKARKQPSSRRGVSKSAGSGQRKVDH